MIVAIVIGGVSTVLVTGCWLLDRWAGRCQLRDVLVDEVQSARLAALPAETVAVLLGEPLPRCWPSRRDRPRQSP